MQRKSIGVVVKGPSSLMKLCPPPALEITSKGLPLLFSTFFNQALPASNNNNNNNNNNGNLGSKAKPSPVQSQCWPVALNGVNVLAIAPTGSGKTFAYTLPMMPHILEQLQAQANQSSKIIKSHLPIALVLVPTRELAVQVRASMAPMKRICSPPLKSVAIYGGQEKDAQLDDLNDKHVVVATPGRLLDLISHRQISLVNVTYFVIDEADRMLNMGFYDQISAIASQVNPERQVVLVSATFPQRLREALTLWTGGDENIVTVRCNVVEGSAVATSSSVTSEVVSPTDTDIEKKKKEKKEKKDNLEGKEGEDDKREEGERGVPMATDSVIVDEEFLSTSKRVVQSVHVCAAHKKPRLLIKFILNSREEEKKTNSRQRGAMLIFVNKIVTLKFVLDLLKRQNIVVDILHGQLPQAQRERTLENFRAGKIHTLLATDVAARGIHIKNLKYVINYDFPSNLEQYIHRVGRTGRQGEGGMTYSLITRNMAPLVKDLIGLLSRCGQHVEPNLQKLASEYNPSTFVLDDDDEPVGGAGLGVEENGDDDDDDDDTGVGGGVDGGVKKQDIKKRDGNGKGSGGKKLEKKAKNQKHSLHG